MRVFFTFHSSLIPLYVLYSRVKLGFEDSSIVFAQGGRNENHLAIWVLFVSLQVENDCQDEI